MPAGETKAALRTLGISPRRRLGQHFMIREEPLAAIVSALDLEKNETVLEIGPGLGFLTRRLTDAGAKVVAVEKDRALADYLRSDFRVIENDILKLDLAHDLGIIKPIKVVGNIPYNITSPILEWLISARRLVQRAVLTVQWEVALRLAARPGTKTWGPLSLFVQVYSEVSLLGKIGRGNFFPSPKVDSAIVRLTFSQEPRFAIRDEEKFFGIVRRSFQKRRKTLLNSLVGDLSKASLTPLLNELHIDPNRRPETLSIEEWIGLTSRLFGP